MLSATIVRSLWSTNDGAAGSRLSGDIDDPLSVARGRNRNATGWKHRIIVEAMEWRQLVFLQPRRASIGMALLMRLQPVPHVSA